MVLEASVLRTGVLIRVIYFIKEFNKYLCILSSNTLVLLLD